MPRDFRVYLEDILGAISKIQRYTNGLSEGADMKVAYDPRTDTLTLVLKEDACVAESDEDKPGVILDYDASGHLVSLEILDASTRVTETRRVEFQLTE